MYSVVVKSGAFRLVVRYEKVERHHRPHVHVIGPGAEAIFSIDSKVECLGYSGFKKHHLSKLEKLVLMYHDELFEEWRRLYEEEN